MGLNLFMIVITIFRLALAYLIVQPLLLYIIYRVQSRLVDI